MTKKINLRIVGTIKAHSEIAISLPDAPSRGGSSVNMAPTKKIGNDRVFYIPASSIRGKYRGAMSEFYIKLVENEKASQLSMSNFLRNSIGGVKGSEKGAPNPKTILELRRKNPFIDAFGGGAPVFVEGAVKISDAVATTARDAGTYHPTTKLGARSFPFIRNPDSLNALIDPNAVEDLQSVAEKKKPWKDALTSLKSIDPDAKPKKEMTASQKSDLLAKAQKKLEEATGEPIQTDDLLSLIKDKVKEYETLSAEVGGSTNSILRPLPPLHTIPQSDFAHSFDIKGAYEHTVGMLFHSLRLASKDMTFGGKTATGHGKVDIEYKIYTFDEDTYAWTLDSTVDMRNSAVTDGVSKPAFEITSHTGKESIVSACMRQFSEAMETEGALDFAFTAFDDASAKDGDDA